MDYSVLDMLGFAPFDPKKDKPVALPGGGIATEYSATSQLPNGEWIVHPQIWWDANGQPHYLPNDKGLEQAMIYEQAGDNKFPRFKTVEEADAYATKRSKKGGGTQGIMSLPTKK